MPVVWRTYEKCAVDDPENRNGKDYPCKVVVKSVEYRGAVLETRERNGYDDSDFYALCWDEATQSVKSVEYATTRGPSPSSAIVDATPEVRAKAAAYYAALAYERLKAAAEEDSKKVKVDREVVNVRARKVPKGMKGRVVYVGANDYGTVLAAVEWEDGQRINVSASALAVVEPEQYVPDEAVLRARAKNAYGPGLLVSPGFVVM